MDKQQLKELEKIYPKIPIGKGKNLTNQHFGRWTALYRTLNDKNNKTRWVCQCKCGTIKTVTTISLGKDSFSCGCLQKEIVKEKSDKKIHIRNKKGEIIKKKCSCCNNFLTLDNFWKNKSNKDGYSGICKRCYNTTVKGRYNIYKKGAKKRKLVFSLTLKEFEEITSKKCYYCNEFSLNKNYSGIDRIDSKKGYEKDNVIPCCEICNKMKMDLNYFDFINKINQIAKNRGEHYL